MDSVTKASASRELKQLDVSLHVRAPEYKLEADLFVRGDCRITLSPADGRLYKLIEASESVSARTMRYSCPAADSPAGARGSGAGKTAVRERACTVPVQSTSPATRCTIAKARILKRCPRMPELPDLTVYIEHLDRRVTGETLRDIRLASPFVLRTVSPSIEEVRGCTVVGLRRLAKQIVFGLDGGLFVVIHLMIAGRLHWHGTAKAFSKRGRNRSALAAFDFASGTLLLSEASRKKRASLRLVRGEDALAALDPGGLEVFATDRAGFVRRLRGSRHTLKRTLTDQHIFAGIGNAYSDEILLHAGLSPFKRAGDLKDAEAGRLFDACRKTLADWTDLLRAKAGERFPARVTAFHDEMAAHGKYRQPCPVCGAPIQRIVHAENESNYCARCQTGGCVLADRSLSRLLKEIWPRRIEELEGD